MNHASSTSSVRLLHVTDFHLFAQSQQRLLGVPTAAALQGVLSHAAQSGQRFDAVLATGDIAQDGLAESYRQALHFLKPLAPELLFLPGNHDQLEVMQQILGKYLPFSVELGAWHIVLLNSAVANSDEGWLAEKELQQLQQLCERSTRPILVAMHHNPVPVGSQWLDPMMIANGHRLTELCAAYPQIKAFVWGHVHQAVDTVLAVGQPRHQVRLMASPATCFQFAPASAQFALDPVDPAYRIIELAPDGSLTTQLQRVPDLGFSPDPASTGY